MEKNVLKIATQLNSLSMTYDHKDWESVFTSGARDILKLDVTSSENKLSWLEIQTNTELYEGALFIKLPEVQETSCSVAHVKFSMGRLAGKSIFLMIKI